MQAIENEIILIEDFKQNLLQIILLLTISAAVFLTGTGRIALTDPDEARYALISRNMIERNNYLEPWLDNKPYYDKPAFYFWLTAGAFKLFGITNFAARLVPVIGAVFLLLGTYIIAANLFNHLIGLFSASILFTTVAIMGFGKFVRMDIYLSAFITLSIYYFIKGYYSQNKSSKWFILMYVPMAFGMLTKGLIGILIPVAVIFIFIAWEGMWQTVWRMRLILGLAIIIIIAGPWFIYMISTHSDYFHEFFIRQHFERFEGKSLGHVESPVIYLAALFIGMLPWTPLAILAFCRYTKSAFAKVRPDASSRLLFIWLIFTIVFFSLGKTKLVNYILPAFVPMTIMLGRFFYDYLNSDFPRRKNQLTFAWSYPSIMLTGLILVAMFLTSSVAAVWIRFQEHWSNIPDLFAGSWWGEWGWCVSMIYRFALAIILIKVLWYFWRNWQLEAMTILIAISTIILTVDLSYTEFPRIADVLSLRRVTGLIEANTTEDDIILAGPEPRWSLQFYLSGQRNVKQLYHLADFSEYVTYSGKMLYLTTDDDSYHQVEWRMPKRVRILTQYRQTRLLLIMPAASTQPTARMPSSQHITQITQRKPTQQIAQQIKPMQHITQIKSTKRTNRVNAAYNPNKDNEEY